MTPLDVTIAFAGFLLAMVVVSRVGHGPWLLILLAASRPDLRDD